MLPWKKNQQSVVANSIHLFSSVFKIFYLARFSIESGIFQSVEPTEIGRRRHAVTNSRNVLLLLNAVAQYGSATVRRAVKLTDGFVECGSHRRHTAFTKSPRRLRRR